MRAAYIESEGHIENLAEIYIVAASPLYHPYTSSVSTQSA